MGMDVFGRAPTGPDGEYFRSNIWHWPTILDAIANAEVLSVDLVERMAFNVGDGPDAEEAERLADAMEARLLEDVVPTPAGNVASRIAQRTADVFGIDGPVTFTTNRGDIVDFIRFCRASGGFAVWYDDSVPTFRGGRRNFGHRGDGPRRAARRPDASPAGRRAPRPPANYREMRP